MEQLAGGYRVIAPDLYGYGESGDWTGNTAHLLRDEAAMVRQVAGKAPETQNAPGDGGGDGTGFHLVGHSYGGAIALRLALETPALLKSLVLIEPIACWLLEDERETPHYREIAGIADAYEAAMTAGDADAALTPYIDYWNGEGAWASMEAGMRDYILGTAGKSAVEFETIFDPTNSVAPLSRVNVPTTVIYGAETRSPARRISEIVVEGIPAAVSVPIAGAGHLSPITHPEPVNQAIAAHLDAFSHP